MKRKLTIVVMVVLAAILIASPVLAAGSSHPMEVAKQGPGKKQKPTVISMTGTISGGDSETGFVVWVQKTNKPFIMLKSQSVTVKVDNRTKCVVYVKGKKSEKIDCGSLGTDDKVSIIGRVVDRKDWTFKARRVQLMQPRIRH